MVQCENGAANTIPPVQMDCALGSLTPQTFSCSYTASIKLRDDGDLHTNFITDDGNATSSGEEGDCPPPSKELAILIYKNEDIIENEEMATYPSGTEISFSCIPSITGERTTWKIVCEQGTWIGRAHDCGRKRNKRFLSVNFINLHLQRMTKDCTIHHLQMVHAFSRTQIHTLSAFTMTWKLGKTT